jgi:hypothetical protein
MNASLLVLKKPRLSFFCERKAFRDKAKMSVQQTYAVLLVLFMVFGIYYVFQLNKNATRGYSVIQLEAQRKKLSYQNDLINIRNAEAESLTVLSLQPILAKMPIVTESVYLFQSDRLTARIK